MSEAHEVGVSLGEAADSARLEALRTELLELQFRLREQDFAVLVQVAGDDRLGARDLLNELHAWLDTRLLTTEAFTEPRPEQAERPFFWRYWTALPPRGRIGIFYRGWLTQTLAERLRGDLDRRALERRVLYARSFERILIEDGMRLVKLWLHLPRDEHRRRLEQAEGDSDLSWRIQKQDRQIFRHYRRGMRALEDLLERTAMPEAPWRRIDSTNAAQRNLAAAQILRDALALGLGDAAPDQPAEPGARSAPGAPVGSESEREAVSLAQVDLGAELTRDVYRERLAHYQKRLAKWARRAYAARIPTVLVFEGWDAAGKGGAIRRVTSCLDAGTYRVFQSAAPSVEEARYPYLWRYWRALPRDGEFAIFDRSWYGRVLVERVEGLASPSEWSRAYDEINLFEDQLVAHGTCVLKFWLHIDPETQLERFRAREQTSFKMYKITQEDYRNRERFEDYRVAAEEMLQKTHREAAPWHVVAANDKRWARVRVLRELSRALRRVLHERRSSGDCD